MAGNRADYDDDGSFGEFMFAAFSDNKPINHQPGNQISAGDDDDWGDFVDNSTQMNGGVEFSNGNARTQSLSKISDFATPFDPFGVSLDSTQRDEPRAPELSRFDSVPNPTKSMEYQFPKPYGALPLSIFGEDEDGDEEEKSGAGEPTFGGDTNFFSKNGILDNKQSGLNNGIGINDLIANLYNQSTKVKAENGPSLITNGSILNSFGSKSDDSGMVSNSNFQDLRVNGLDLNSNQLDSELAVKNEDDDEDDGWDFKSAETEVLKEDGGNQGVADESGHDASESGHSPSKSYDFSNWTSHRADDWNLGFESIPRARSQNNLTSDWYAESKSREAGDGTTPVNGNFWELRDAFTESRSVDISEAPVPNICSSSVEVSKVESEGPRGLRNSFPESNMISGESQGLNFGLDFNAGFPSLGDCALDSIETKKYDIVKGLTWSPVHENGNSDVTLGTSEDSGKEIGQKPLGNNTNLNIFKEALPESLFGIEKLQTNGSLECQKTSLFDPTFDRINKETAGLKLSVNDLLLTLYNQPEEKSSANHTLTFGESERDFLSMVSEPRQASGDKDFVDDSWEFKDASSGGVLYSHAEQSSFANDTPKLCDTELQSSVFDNNFYVGCKTSWELKDISSDTRSKFSSQVQWDSSKSSADVVGSDLVKFEDDFGDDSWEFKDASTDINLLSIPSSVVSIKLELSDYVNLYSKLIEQLYYASLNHLENLKKVQKNTVLSSGDTVAEAFDEEIKEFSNALSQCEMIMREWQSADHAPQDLNLHELVEILKEPKYQVLESEYQLSSRLATAEKDFRSSVEVLKHVASTVQILNLKSREEQSDYLAMWSKIVSVCSQELKHGAHIWKQVLVNHVNDLILSTPQGKQYFRALGEIFRVVEIIGASAKMYKPWILVGSGETRSLLASLNECSVTWFSLGLEDALKMVSSEQERTETELLQSIKYIHDLDEFALQNQVISPTFPKCWMSALPLDLLPGLKTVEWEGENYLLNLANLWANLISPDPPKS